MLPSVKGFIVLALALTVPVQQVPAVFGTIAVSTSVPFLVPLGLYELLHGFTVTLLYDRWVTGYG